jgi:hypothetical protein
MSELQISGLLFEMKTLPSSKDKLPFAWSYLERFSTSGTS